LNPLNDLFGLTGKRALITGSTKGIGYTLAKGLASAGAEVIINARHQDTVDHAKEKLTALGFTAYGLVFDVTNRQQLDQAINEFEATTGAIDILINNAGIQLRAPLEDFETDDFDHLMVTNVNSVFYVSQTIARHMIRRGEGKIINIASVQSALARPTIAPYTASKGAVSNLTKGMTTDWAKYGIQINALAPGYFETPLTEALVNDTQFNTWLCNRTPSNRWGKLDELIGACIFLSSNASSFVNGQTIYVDGGITACI
jgi:gluconate 5-dehydrogenase